MKTVILSPTNTITLLLVFVQAMLYILRIGDDYSYIFTCSILALAALTRARLIPVFLMYAFFFKYFYVSKYYYIDGVDISQHASYQSSELFSLVSLLNSLFLLGLGYGLGNIIKKSIPIQASFKKLKSKWLFYLLAFNFVMMSYYGLSGESIIEGGGYGTSQIHKSTIFEYAIVFFAASCCCMNFEDKVQRFVLTLLFLGYAIKAFAYGARIETLQISLIFLYFRTNYLSSNKLLGYFFIFISYVVFVLVGAIRASPYEFLQLFSFDVFIKLFISDDSLGIISNQYGDVFQSSSRVVGLVKNNIITTEDRFFSFLLYIISPATVFLEASPLANLSSYTPDATTSGGGGLISSYSYVWLSYIGPILFGFVIGRFIRFHYTTSNVFVIFYAFMLLVTFPRWFAYYPLTIIKLCIFAVIVLLVCKSLIMLKFK